MTIAVGGLYPQGAFVLADSRALVISLEGKVIDYFDDVQKSHIFGNFCIAVAGDGFFGNLVMHTLFEVMTQGVYIDYKGRAQTIVSMVDTIYQKYAARFNRSPKLMLVVASVNNENTTNFDSVIFNEPHMTFADLNTFNQLFTAGSPFNEPGFLLSLELPEGAINYRKSYGIISIGSGQYFDRKLKGITTTFIDPIRSDIPRSIVGLVKQDGAPALIEFQHKNDIQAIWESIAARIQFVLMQTQDEITFNEILHGFTIQANGAVFAKWMEGFKITKMPFKFRREGLTKAELPFKMPKPKATAFWEMVGETIPEYKGRLPMSMVCHDLKFWFVNPDDKKLYPLDSDSHRFSPKLSTIF